MKYTIRLALTRDYFTEAFDQSLRYAKWWYKVEKILGAIFIIIGMGVFIWSDENLAAVVVLIIIGLYELLNPLLKKPWWVNSQMKSKSANSEIELIFAESGIESHGPYSQGTMAWEGIDRILETPKGVLIWPQKGIHIYLPKSKLETEVINYILSKTTD